MDLTGIISISGRPGLYKVITQGKNSVIVASVIDKRHFPAYATDKISALEDISIYTLESDVPLKEVFTSIYKKYGGKQALSHKEDIINLQEVLFELLPDYDEDRVYPSDIKKLFQWYNMLLKSGNIKLEEPKKEEKPKAEKKDTAEKKTEKKTAAKKPAAKKTAAKSTTAKKPATKKASTKK